MTLTQIGAHSRIEFVIIEQHIELLEHRIGLLGQFGHARKHIFCRIAIDQHGFSPQVSSSGHAVTLFSSL